jgi:hypothetical protein
MNGMKIKIKKLKFMFKEIVLEAVDWVQLAPDVDQRRAVAKTVINFGFPTRRDDLGDRLLAAQRDVNRRRYLRFVKLYTEQVTNK